MTPLEQIADSMNELALTSQRAAVRAAPALLDAVKATFAHGQIRGLIANTTARADGSSVVLVLDERLPVAAIHAGDNADMIRGVIEVAVAEELGK